LFQQGGPVQDDGVLLPLTAEDAKGERKRDSRGNVYFIDGRKADLRGGAADLGKPELRHIIEGRDPADIEVRPGGVGRDAGDSERGAWYSYPGTITRERHIRRGRAGKKIDLQINVIQLECRSVVALNT